MSERNDLPFIEHINDSVNAIKDFTKGIDKDNFMSSRLIQSAVVREIEVIGEAAKNVSNSLKERYPEIKWKEIVGTRDKTIHRYFGVDFNQIWSIVDNDLPILEEQIKKIKRGLNKI